MQETGLNVQKVGSEVNLSIIYKKTGCGEEMEMNSTYSPVLASPPPHLDADPPMPYLVAGLV
jgi:hypothetical protein